MQKIGNSAQITSERPMICKLPNPLKYLICTLLEPKDVVTLALTYKSFLNVDKGGTPLYQNNKIWEVFYRHFFPPFEPSVPNEYYKICSTHYTLTENIFKHNFIHKQIPSTPPFNLQKINLVAEENNGDFKFTNILSDDRFSLKIGNQKWASIGTHFFVATEQNTYKFLNFNEIDKNGGPQLTIDSMNKSALKCSSETQYIRSNECKKYIISAHNSEIIITLGKSFKNMNLLVEVNNIPNIDNKDNNTADNKEFVICVLDNNYQNIKFEKKIDIEVMKTAKNIENKIYIELSGHHLSIRDIKTEKTQRTSASKITVFDLKENKEINTFESKHPCITSPSLNQRYILQLISEEKIEIYDVLKRKKVCDVYNFAFSNIQTTFSLQPYFGLANLLFVPKTDNEGIIRKVEILDLEEGNLIDSLTHGPSDPIKQIIRIDNSLITASETTLKVWNTVEKKHFYLANLENPFPFAPIEVYGNYILNFNPEKNRIFTWHVKTGKSAVFNDLPLHLPPPHKIAFMGNLFALMFTQDKVINTENGQHTIYEHKIHILEMEQGRTTVFTQNHLERAYSITFSRIGLFLYPTKTQGPMPLEIFKFVMPEPLETTTK